MSANSEHSLKVRREVMGDTLSIAPWAAPLISPAAAGFRQRARLGRCLDQ
jgi:hypothetical protein